MSQPYLSVVVSGSNAGYGGNFLTRLQNCVDDKAQLARIVPSEFVMVEWNPPEGRARLKDAIAWPHDMPVRIITVPHSLHVRYFNPGNFPFLEYMAKNVGIRRANGQFILSTNADILIGDRLQKRIGNQRDLEETCFYRANRHDMDANARTFQICYANGVFPPGENVWGKSKTGVPFSPDMLHFNASGDFMLMSRKNWHDLGGFPENTGYLITLDGEMVWIAHSAGLKQVTFTEPIYHQFHDHSGADRKPWYMPPNGWSDSTPRGTKNIHETWGLESVSGLQEEYL